ncbi:DUF882 domain-containing protein [Klebsiella grimontii]
MDKFDANRRKLLALGGAALGAAAILPAPAFATLSTPRPRILTLNNLHTGESLKAEFFDGRGYIQDELARLNHFFRDYRANKIKSIDPGLFDQLYRLQGLLGTNKPVQLISGYRSEEVTGELPADLEYEEFNEIREQLAALIEGQLVVYKEKGLPLDLGLVVREYLSQYPRARHFDVARIVVDQAVRLGVAQADFTGLPAKWQPINDYGAKVQAHVIDKY